MPCVLCTENTCVGDGIVWLIDTGTPRSSLTEAGTMSVCFRRTLRLRHEEAAFMMLALPSC